MKILTIGALLFIFVACQSGGEGKDALDQNNTETDHLKAGANIAQSTFKVMSGELKAAMKKGGVQNAIEYCNVNAYPISDSLADFYNANIKRTSLQFRNPLNRPDSSEIEVIVAYKESLLSGEPMKPMVKVENGKSHFYAPIVTQALCLKCHGIPGIDIGDSDYSFIKSKYPNDMAIGFAEGDLRGIWSISLDVE